MAVALPRLALLALGLLAPLAQGCGDSDGFRLGGQATNLTLVTGPTLPIGRSGTTYATTLQAAGGRPPYSWTLLTGALPKGITLVPTTGQLGGPPTVAGEVARFRIRVIDQDGAYLEQDFLLAIEKELVITTTSPLGGARVNVSYLQQLASTGGTLPVTWSVPSSSVLPPGFVLNRLTGQLVGQPTKSGTFSFLLTATDTANESGQASATKSFDITVVQ